MSVVLPELPAGYGWEVKFDSEGDYEVRVLDTSSWESQAISWTYVVNDEAYGTKNLQDAVDGLAAKINRGVALIYPPKDTTNESQLRG